MDALESLSLILDQDMDYSKLVDGFLYSFPIHNREGELGVVVVYEPVGEDGGVDSDNTQCWRYRLIPWEGQE